MLQSSAGSSKLQLPNIKWLPILCLTQPAILPYPSYWLSQVDFSLCFQQGRGYQVGRESTVELKESVADSFSPTTCPSLPSFIPYFAFQCHPTSTLSSYLRITPLWVLGRLSKYPCRPLQFMFQAISVTESTVASRHFFAKSQQLGIAQSFRGVLPTGRFQVCTRRSSICWETWEIYYSCVLDLCYLKAHLPCFLLRR